MNEEGALGGTAPDQALSRLVVPLLKGIVYRENDAGLWNDLIKTQARAREYVSVLGLELVIDESEGYAFLRARVEPGDDPELEVPRLVARRPLSFPVSLLLALLRKKLTEFDAGGGDTRLVLSRDEIVEMLRVFLPENTNEARVIDRVDAHLNRIVELGFLRRMRSEGSVPGTQTAFEVQRIIKAFVDAQWLGELDARLRAYRAELAGTGGGRDEQA